MVNPLRWRGHEVSRLEAFSDTVFAFALTLVVVALGVPRDYDKLIELMLGFPAFACCFALLIWIWLELSPIAPTAFILMGPFHWIWGVRARKRREALEERLAGEIESAAGYAAPSS